ncbi:cyclopropane-fatty-acyl-phospholipid synthase family protein [Nonomuraea sp. NEAU-A123]|uniref:SAM-dependent methyltransferase n=1 Tax=Nonomuraea sp. NEAU-A123 TaxID=2839649 RepID=UPI001BE46DCE|nr:class I SAM-dependent methyltransferase [Nonomuraea sp. NEAU-A123]MBT2233564.1 class I SAM-dependent methyltransferase [Nonomuraea sp. NEAU-A123]
MSEPKFDAEGLFDDDYLYFFAGHLDARSDAEAELIWELLDLQPHMEVLDLACGHGRISNRLAQRGCRVTGLDSSRLFLDRARQDADALGVTIDYVHGDMRQLPWTARFDRIVSWFTAFGFFSDSENQRVLVQAAATLKPGGKIALELNNYSAIVRTYQRSTVVERDGDLVIDQHHLDLLTSRNVVNRTIIRDGRTRNIPYFVRMFTFTELRDQMFSAGFTTVHALGADGTALTIDSRRMIVIAER